MPTYNKVVYDGQTLIDLTGDTVTSAADIVSGKIGHLADGSIVVGTASAGSGSGGDIVFGYDELVSVGEAQVGTATTGTPNYTPSGEVSLNTESVAVVNGATLNYYASSTKLYITGITTTTENIAIPTSATFTGNGVKFKVSYAEEEEE